MILVWEKRQKEYWRESWVKRKLVELKGISVRDLFEKPFVSICLPKTDPPYDPKLESFLEVLGYKAIDVMVPAREIAGKVQQIWTNRQKFLEELSPKIAKLREGSGKNMRMVQSILENVT